VNKSIMFSRMHVSRTFPSATSDIYAGPR